MRLRRMTVRMRVYVVAMTVCMRMDVRRLRGGSLATEPANGAGEVGQSKNDQHDGDGELHPEPKPWRDHPFEEDDAAADEQNRERVANAPGRSDHRRAANISVARDDRRNGDDMIGIGGVAHPEHEA